MQMIDQNIANGEYYIVGQRFYGCNREEFIYMDDFIYVKNGILYFNKEKVYSNVEKKDQYNIDMNEKFYVSHNKNLLVVTIEYRGKTYDLITKELGRDSTLAVGFTFSSFNQVFEQNYTIYDIKQLYEDIFECYPLISIGNDTLLKRCQKAILLNELENCSSLFHDLLFIFAINTLKTEKEDFLPRITKIGNIFPIMYEDSEHTSYININQHCEFKRFDKYITIKYHVSTGYERIEADHFNGGLWHITPYEDKEYIISFPTKYLCDKYKSEYIKIYGSNLEECDIAVHKSFRNHIKFITENKDYYGSSAYENKSYYDIGYTYYCGKVTEVIIKGEEWR